MKRNEFLDSLRKELEKNRVEVIDDILLEFEDHFDHRLEEGKTEEEVARRIGNPVDLAKDYAQPTKHKTKSGSWIAIIGLIFLDLFVFPLILTAWISVLVLLVFGISAIVLGVVMLLSLNIASLIPSMPYLSSMLFGIAILGMSLLSLLGTWTLSGSVRQWTKAYFRFHGNAWFQKSSLPIPLQPRVSKKMAWVLRNLNTIALVMMVVFMVAGYLVSALSAGSFEFWHVWHWFV